MGRAHWGLDYRDESGTTTTTRVRATAAARSALDAHSAPPGFPPKQSPRDPSALRRAFPSTSSSDAAADPAADAARLRQAYNRAWGLAFAPARGLLTGAFAIFVSGSGVHLFSLMTAVTILLLQLQGLFGAPAAFAAAVAAEPGLKGRLRAQFCMHIGLCWFGVCGALFQWARLGFLPTTNSDWAGLLPPFDAKAGPQFAGGVRF